MENHHLYNVYVAKIPNQQSAKAPTEDLVRAAVQHITTPARGLRFPLEPVADAMPPENNKNVNGVALKHRQSVQTRRRPLFARRGRSSIFSNWGFGLFPFWFSMIFFSRFNFTHLCGHYALSFCDQGAFGANAVPPAAIAFVTFQGWNYPVVSASCTFWCALKSGKSYE